MKIFYLINKILRACIKLEVKRVKNNELKWLKKFNIDLVLDVGANIGEFAKEINCIKPSVKIFCFEPIIECANKIQEIQNADITVFNTALGENKGQMTLYISEHLPSSSLLNMHSTHLDLFPHTKPGIDRVIEINTLNNMVDSIKPFKNIFLKIDVQGYEYKVLKGATNVLSRISFIQIEINYAYLYEQQCTFNEVYVFLQENGFSFYGPLTNNCDDVGLPIYGDLLFYNSDLVKLK